MHLAYFFAVPLAMFVTLVSKDLQLNVWGEALYPSPLKNTFTFLLIAFNFSADHCVICGGRARRSADRGRGGR